MPDLPLNPDDIGDELTPEQIALLAISFVKLANYVQSQQTKCGAEPDGR